MATDAERAEYDRMVSSGMPHEEAVDRVKQLRAIFAPSEMQARQAGPVQPQFTPGQSAAMGAVNAGTGGFADELMGLTNMMHAPGIYPAGMDANPLGKYRSGRDQARERFDVAHDENPWPYRGGQFAAGTAVTAPLIGPGLPGAMAGGAATGMITGIGESRADLGANPEGVASDAVLGGGIGAAAGLAGYGIAKGVGKLVNRFRGNKGAVDAVLPDIDKNAASQINPNQTIGQSHAAALEEEALYASRGIPLKYNPAQSTGDPGVLGQQQYAGKFKDTYRAPLEEAATQKQQTGKLLESFTDDMAADPAQLGRGNVGDDMTQELEDALGTIRGDRGVRGKANYGAAEELLGNTPFDTADVAGSIKHELGRLPANAGAFGERLLKTLDALAPEGSTQTTYQRIRAEQSYWRGVARDAASGTPAEGLDKANTARVANEIADKLQASIDKVEQSGAGEGVEALRHANKTYRADTEALEQAQTKTVGAVIKADASDTVMDKLKRASPEQIEGVFKLLKPNTRKQVIAQFMEDRFVKAGKAPRGSRIAEEHGVNYLEADKALKEVYEAEAQLHAMFGDDPYAQMALDRMVKLLQRIRIDNTLQAAPEGGNAVATAGKEAVKAASFAQAGPKGLAATRAVEALFTNHRQIGQALSTREGIDVFNRALAAYSGEAQLSEKAARALIASMERIGLTAYSESDDEEEFKPRSEPYRPKI